MEHELHRLRKSGADAPRLRARPQEHECRRAAMAVLLWWVFGAAWGILPFVGVICLIIANAKLGAVAQAALMGLGA